VISDRPVMVEQIVRDILELVSVAAREETIANHVNNLEYTKHNI
jgi:hypothetical protein